MRATPPAPAPGRAPTRQELRPAVAAAFGRESYRPGEIAQLRLLEHAAPVALEVFQVGRRRAGPGCEPRGRAVGHVQRLPAEDAHALRFRVAAWPTGLYFARLAAGDGRIGFAPFVVRPRPLGLHRVAVVLPTLTWQAYNLRDADGDGVGDTWYADWGRRTARLGRAYLDRGVPYNFCSYDLPFLRWLALTGREADFLTDGDLARVASAHDLARAYDLLVFPGHHEYVTTREYNLVERYRDLGGNLLFLSANNFFWRVVRRGATIERTRQWRDLGRSEAALVGVQYRGNDDGSRRAPWIVRAAQASSWLFAGTGLTAGSRFGRGGIEIDATTPASPAGTQVVAEIPRLFGPGYTAQMTYYETPAGARVFAAGAFRLLERADDPVAARLLENLWGRLARG